MDGHLTKTCTTCGLLKTLEEFAIQKKAKDGRAWKCKECMKVYCKERYEKNNASVEELEKIVAYMKDNGCE